jgi:hypothetical protein
MQTADHPKSLKAQSRVESYHFALSACGKIRPTVGHDFTLNRYFFVCLSWTQFADFWKASCEA